jgi:cytochrome c peroxidase
MHNNRYAHPRSILVAALLSVTAAGSSIAADPPGLAPLPAPAKINEARAKLGGILFFDSRLAGDTSNACATCHDPAKGWGDGKPLSDSYTSLLYFRNAPSLFNVAGRKYLMWDGRLDGGDLGTSVRDMITEAHTMNMDTRLAQERLKQSPEYMALFEAAYGKGDPYGGKIYGAIAEYVKSIVTTNAPLDKYLKGDAAALSEQQKAGLALFTGKAGCAACHSGPMLSDGKLHVTGAPDNPEVNANVDRQVVMLRHFATMGTPNYMNLRADVGHYVVSKDTKDIGRFATPSLWDVGQTAPYMHSGMFKTLAEVVDFYDKGGGTAPNKTPQIKPLNLTADEKAALVAFLEAMTGDKPNVPKPQIPKDAPRTHGTN